MLLLLAMLASCTCLAAGVAGAGGLAAYVFLRCPNCGRMPLAGRTASGWPDFSTNECPHCGARRA